MSIPLHVIHDTTKSPSRRAAGPAIDYGTEATFEARRPEIRARGGPQRRGDVVKGSHNIAGTGAARKGVPQQKQRDGRLEPMINVVII